MLLYAKNKYIDSIEHSLNNLNDINIWQKDDIPDNLHIKNSPRTPTITLLAKNNTYICRHNNSIINKNSCGYNIDNDDMYGVFFAIGPDFKRNYTINEAYNTDIYSLISKILEIKPADSDGKLQRILSVLNKKE
jgi:alkaline phosphatase D